MYRFNDIGTGAGSGAAALALDGVALRPPARPVFGQKVEALRGRAGELDLIVDLGQRIGSREWFRGLFTCLALCYAAWSLAPGLGPIAGSSPLPYPDAEFEQARALTIAPLAYGADTGRRMAPTDAVQPLAETPERPVIDLRATLGRGDGLARMLERSGVGAAEADPEPGDDLIEDQKDAMIRVAEALLEREVLDGEEVKRLLEGKLLQVVSSGSGATSGRKESG